MEIQIAVNPDIESLVGLKNYLELQPFWNEAGLTLQLRRAGIRVRGIDPTILVAIVSAAGMGLGALIAGLLQIAQQGSAKKIIIESENGARLEFPATMKPEEIDVLIDKLRDLDAQKIILP